ncbi:MAG: PilZ domain-containing protein [Candidatus Zixiibacteriota bacterium]
MTNKRKIDRKQATYYMTVLNKKTEEITGNIRDISPDGIKLVTSHPIKPGEVFKFGIALPDALTGEIPLTVEAKSVYCRKNTETDLYHTGFKLHNATDDQRKAIAESLDSFLFTPLH